MAGFPRSVCGRVSSLLVEQGLSGLLVAARSATDPDLAPFVGEAHLGESLLLVTGEGTARLAVFSPMERDEALGTGLEVVTPAELDLARCARESPRPEDFLARAIGALLVHAGVAASAADPPRLALAGHSAGGTLHAACRALESQGWSFADGGPLLREGRKSKGERELAAAWRAADGTVAAFRAVAGLLAGARLDAAGEAWLAGERLRVGRLRLEVRRVLAEHALEQPQGNLLACGGDAGVPHSQGADERQIHAGVPVLVDLFPKGRLFADCTRVFCLGEVPETVRRAHAAVLQALRWSHAAAANAGARAWTLQEGVCGLFLAAGYPTPLTDPGTTVGYVHGLGHGVGYELHEDPSFKKDAGREGLLAEGDLFTLEPGLYDPNPENGYGVRLEDLCRLGPNGIEILTPLPYDLNPRAWG